MGLRCKVGDLAIILAGQYEGYFVTCLQFIGRARGKFTDGTIGVFDDLWEITYPAGRTASAGTNGRCSITDKSLLPIRPDELKEETEQEVTA